MNIVKATKKYEKWLGSIIPLVQEDLELKHKRMAESPFAFLRGAFYRWVQLFEENCSKLVSAPSVLAVGDLHVENFGTWRDLEGRLIWGINDFDEAYYLPYTNDLLRLAVSACLAIKEVHLGLKYEDAIDEILKGYNESLSKGGNPFVLGDKYLWFYEIAGERLKNPAKFWNKMDACKEIKSGVPGKPTKILSNALPIKNLSHKRVHRIAGTGSLGRQRFVAIAEWQGGRIAREVKAYAPSACVWANGKNKSCEGLYNKIIQNSVRCHDPFVTVKGGWVLRRLAPDCSRIELDSVPNKKDEKRLLYSMGWETANIHLGSKGQVKKIIKDLKKRNSSWLLKASEEMTRVIKKDWKDWKEHSEQKNNLSLHPIFN
jgi:hypothetical protein